MNTTATHYSSVDINLAESTPIIRLLSSVFIILAGLAIFQDFVESNRNGFPFYLSESILFKTVWMLFIPILAVLYTSLKKHGLHSALTMTMFIIVPIAAHVILLPLISTWLSYMFYGGRYDFYKMFSYTIANDLTTMIVVYAGFVMGFKLIHRSNDKRAVVSKAETIQPQKLPDRIVVNNGKENVIIHVAEIVQITSASPYVYLHLEQKKVLHSETLKSIGEKLDSSVFIRIHKSTLVNITKVRTFTSRLNGDYDVLLTNGDSVRLSRTYTAQFKKQFNLRTQMQDVMTN